MRTIRSIFFAALAALPGAVMACDMPSSEGRADLYGHTSNRSGIDMLNPNFRDSVAANFFLELLFPFPMYYGFAKDLLRIL